MAKSTYYYWVKKLDKPDKYQEIKEAIITIVSDSKGRYGYRRVTVILKKRGLTINHKTVRKLMSGLNLTCQVKNKKYKSYKGAVGKTAKNIMKREFCATKPNQKWATDVTEFSLFGTKLYLSPVIDLFNGELIAYTLYKNPVYRMVSEVLNNND